MLGVVLSKDARARAVSIENVVEDTTPELGGNLDLNNNNINGTPSSNIEIPNSGIAINAAGTKPIIVLIKADEVKAKIISEILSGDTNKLIIFLLHISSRNIILKLMLALNKKSYKIAAVNITPTVLL